MNAMRSSPASSCCLRSGAFLSDRAGLGTGILLSAPFFHEVVRAAEAAAGVPAGKFYDTIGGFVAIDLRDGVNAARFIDTLGDGVRNWDSAGRQPAVHVDPVRPAQIADLASIRTAPPLLAGLIALTMVIGLVAGLGRAIRIRRREAGRATRSRLPELDKSTPRCAGNR